MRGAVPVLISAHLITIVVTRQVSALNPALRIPPPLYAMLKKPTAQIAHLVFADTQATAKKTKRAIFCQRTDGQLDNYSNIFYLEKRDIKK